jgi:hypothetical protein
VTDEQVAINIGYMGLLAEMGRLALYDVRKGNEHADDAWAWLTNEETAFMLESAGLSPAAFAATMERAGIGER